MLRIIVFPDVWAAGLCVVFCLLVGFVFLFLLLFVCVCFCGCFFFFFSFNASILYKEKNVKSGC